MRRLRRTLKPLVVQLGAEGLAERYVAWRAGVPLRIVNLVFQRFVGLNGDCPFPVNFTSRVNVAKRLHVHPTVMPYFATSGGSYFQAFNGIYIDAGTIIAPGVKIVSADHDQAALDRHVTARPIVIGKRCWISAGAILLPETTLGDDVVVAAGAVVKGQFPSGCLLAGVPARIVRDRPRQDAGR